jgi:hypothetical protein
MNRRKGMVAGYLDDDAVMWHPWPSGELVSDFETYPTAVFERLLRHAPNQDRMIAGFLLARRTELYRLGSAHPQPRPADGMRPD